MSKLFTPYDLSGLQLANRVVMAPMTRTRTPENILLCSVYHQIIVQRFSNTRF